MKQSKIIIVFLLIGTVWSLSTHEKAERFAEKYIKVHFDNGKYHIHSRMEELILHCPKGVEKLKEALVNFDECVLNIDKSLTVCESLQIMTSNCSTQYVKVLDDCSPDISKGLADLAMSGLKSTFDYLCHASGETIFEFFNPCVWKDLEEKNEELQECEERINLAGTNFRKRGLEVKTTCKFVHPFKSCVKARVTGSCKNPKTSHAFVGLYDAFIKPCNEIIDKLKSGQI